MGVLDADLVLVDGKVVTVDSEDSIAEAVAARDGVIVAVGASSDIIGLAGDFAFQSRGLRFLSHVNREQLG